ncbi:MAG: hypothetical protein IPL59_10400 [Candidatus Competibacteraceae bacterium]|nr:hypothetical protein [Candidatus Competibacteraceae bacterium]
MRKLSTSGIAQHHAADVVGLGRAALKGANRSDHLLRNLPRRRRVPAVKSLDELLSG